MSTVDVKDPKSIAITEEAIERVETHADGDWKEGALAAIEQVAVERPRLTALEVWAKFDQTHGEFARTGTHRLCAMGSVFRRAAGLKLIRRTGDYVNGPSGGIGGQGHTKALPVWESLIYRKESAE
jgi:hypothetical protein